MANPVERWYASIPPVTRGYLTITCVVTAGCALEVRARATIDLLATATPRHAIANESFAH